MNSRASGVQRMTGRLAMSVREFVSLHADEFGDRQRALATKLREAGLLSVQGFMARSGREIERACPEVWTPSLSKF